MREILFRGKAINRENCYHRTEYKNGEWVYGLVTKLYDEQFEKLPAEMTDINGISNIEIDYKTIGQYTGMLDNNNIKIFEGDIVAFSGSNDELTNYEILWHRNRWIVRERTYNAVTDLNLSFCNRSVVIGNVYDNPELLRGC